MYQKIINFIKYHNAFTIGLVLVFVFSGAIFASEDIRDAVIGEEIVTEQGIDNSQLLSADTENFDINLKINNVFEDEENYYIDYTFNTIAVRDNIWQPVVKSEKFTVNKTGLGNRDLGIYLAEELGETVRSELVYLKEAQKNERERGMTQIVKTTDYTGLIGLTLDLKNKILAGYEPVVKPPVVEIIQEPIVQEPICQPSEEICDQIDNNCNGEIDEGGVCPEGEPSAPYGAGETAPPPAEDVCDSTYLNLCLNEADCQTAAGFWHNDVCNVEPENTEPEPLSCTPTDEICDGQDNNCDGNIDENCTCPEGFSDCDNDMTNGCETQTKMKMGENGENGLPILIKSMAEWGMSGRGGIKVL